VIFEHDVLFDVLSEGTFGCVGGSELWIFGAVDQFLFSLVFVTFLYHVSIVLSVTSLLLLYVSFTDIF
jgi:hypothetical protein